MEKQAKQRPQAYAKVKGSKKYENVRGNVFFYSTYGGSVVVAEIYGIPPETEESAGGFLGFHIHNGDSCTGTAEDVFSNTDGHYNPDNTMHPMHRGDLPPLLSSNGVAWMSVYTGRFYPEEVVGRTAVIHGMPDDFKTQPAGGAGEKIACGEILLWDSDYR